MAQKTEAQHLAERSLDALGRVQRRGLDEKQLDLQAAGLMRALADGTHRVVSDEDYRELMRRREADTEES